MRFFGRDQTMKIEPMSKGPDNHNYLISCYTDFKFCGLSVPGTRQLSNLASFDTEDPATAQKILDEQLDTITGTITPRDAYIMTFEQTIFDCLYKEDRFDTDSKKLKIVQSLKNFRNEMRDVLTDVVTLKNYRDTRGMAVAAIRNINVDLLYGAQPTYLPTA